MQNFQCWLLVLKQSFICYYIICMTVPLRYFGFPIWKLLPIEIREDHLISSFVTKIKQ